ncbi:MAG: FAD-dependent oxidoreductase [Methanobacteriota archaeon]|nr:MAG: FAD-dependent oxidoreductase [Euryarchaeota archaeon]
MEPEEQTPETPIEQEEQAPQTPVVQQEPIAEPPVEPDEEAPETPPTPDSEELRIGVFVCHCGTNIGGFVDVPAVVEYVKTLPNVAFARDNLYTCAEDGLTAIRDAIKEHKLNRVIVASCTPRTHAPLFQGVCEEAGLNKYLFEFANIREQCSWVHMKEKEDATRKAKDLIKSSVSKAALLVPQEEMKVDVVPRSLVIGGGVAGLSAALSVARQGFDVHLVEKEGVLGGFTRNLNSLSLGDKSAEDTIKPLIEHVQAHENITVHLNSQVESVSGFIGNFDTTIVTNGSSKEVKVGTIIVATGALEYIPEGLYGYGMYDNVVTLTEFEILCKSGKLPKIKNVAFIQCVGSRGQDKSYCSRICCVISIKNALYITENFAEIMGEEGAERVEVDVSVPEISSRRRRRRRMVSAEGEAAPGPAPTGGPEITIFNRDVTTYGADHEVYYNKAREKRIRFVRYTTDNLPKVTQEGDKLVVNYYHETLKTERKLQADMVVLATPLIAPPDAADLSKKLKIPIGRDGFFLEAHMKLRPIDFATDGIFVCGTARGPADITESVAQGLGTASRAAIPMARGFIQAEAILAQVDPEICTGCGTCEANCPYGAIRLSDDGVAEVLAAACKGCGCCGATCPEKAIQMMNYTDDQLLAQGRSILQGAM